ncbi:hypothetical protein H5410_026119 [Solanum commersonii]|uniref:Uncharacterized protein n=1 Tax=Solanum commersonii TaxID=4109 RepID=A0A9J5YV60_SOLCO|nr:hypothetical protein H5410_026119 [Solanum commersonii]
MEGFQEAMDKIKRQLLGGSSQLDIISIVVTPHFDVHAKCRVTQLYSWKELLLTILNDVLDPAGKEDVWDSPFYICAPKILGIILTTRLSDVANYAKCDSEPHHHPSWTLLQEEVFQGESCPPELVDVGFRIAKKMCRVVSILLKLLKYNKSRIIVWKESLGKGDGYYLVQF